MQTTTDERLEAIARIRELARASREHRARADRLEDARDDAIRDAIAAGASWQDITNAAGISKPRVYQIRDRRR